MSYIILKQFTFRTLHPLKGRPLFAPQIAPQIMPYTWTYLTSNGRTPGDITGELKKTMTDKARVPLITALCLQNACHL